MRGTWFLVLLLACGTAQSAEWISIGTGVDNEEIFIDATSIRRTGSIRRVWTKIVYAPQSKKISPGPAWVNRMVSLDAFNCDDELTRTESMAAYLEDGSIRRLPPERYPTKWEPVPPETYAEGIMNIVCLLKAESIDAATPK